MQGSSQRRTTNFQGRKLKLFVWRPRSFFRFPSRRTPWQRFLRNLGVTRVSLRRLTCKMQPLVNIVRKRTIGRQRVKSPCGAPKLGTGRVFCSLSPPCLSVLHSFLRLLQPSPFCSPFQKKLIPEVYLTFFKCFGRYSSFLFSSVLKLLLSFKNFNFKCVLPWESNFPFFARKLVVLPFHPQASVCCSCASYTYQSYQRRAKASRR